MTTESLPHVVYCPDDPQFMEHYPSYFDAHQRWKELYRVHGHKKTYLICNEFRTMDPAAHITDCNE